MSFTNKRFEEIIGYSKDELIGEHCENFIDDDAMEVFKNNVDKQCKNIRKDAFEATYVTKGNKKVSVLVSTSYLYKDGNYDGIINAITDLTEIKLLKEELYQSEKLTLLGTLAGEIAHEVNNPLSGLLLATQMLIDDAKTKKIDRKELVKELQDIEKDAIRCKKFIEKILGFTRMVPEEKCLLDINETIKDAMLLVQRQAKLKNISIVNAFSSAQLHVWGNSNQLQQVIINIVNNARDALSISGGTIIIKTCAKTEKGKKIVSIEINDTGKGIPDSVMPKLFGSFVTTKAAGTGLGLSVSKKIIEEHGGTITAANLKNQGASFIITLPRKRREALGSERSE